MSEFLRDDFLKDDSGDDVEAHSAADPMAMPMEVLKDDGDDVEAHSMLGPQGAQPMDVMDVMRDDDKSRKVL
jgi:hypothetical protein